MTQGNWFKQSAWLFTLALVLPLSAWSAEERERGVGDVVYVPTPQIVVDEMLKMARTGPSDFIIDLGSGDGRMVITAAKKFGARGFGVDLSDDLLAEARANAKAAGVADRAEFRKQNLFETDLKQATVISTYLLPEMNLRLRPKFLDLPPGTRIVAHAFGMADWRPDESEMVEAERVFFWRVPAKVAGNWVITQPGRTLDVTLTQDFQKLGGTLNADAGSVDLLEPKLSGNAISFVVDDAGVKWRYSGQVSGKTIAGTASANHRAPVRWRARPTQ